MASRPSSYVLRTEACSSWLPYTLDPSTKAVRSLYCCLTFLWHTGVERTKLRQVAVRLTQE